MAEYTLFRCDQCQQEQSGPMGSLGPNGWLQLLQQGNGQTKHFCSYACMVLYGHEQADYRAMPRAERLRTALQSLGILPRPGASKSE